MRSFILCLLIIGSMCASPPPVQAWPQWCLNLVARLRGLGDETYLPSYGKINLRAYQANAQILAHFRRLISSYQEFANEADAAAQGHPELEALTQEERVAIYAYANKDYAQGVNRALWSRTNLGTAQGFVVVLASALNRLPNVAARVYRRARLSNQEISRYVRGATVFERSFISTSQSPDAVSLNPSYNVRFVVSCDGGKDIAHLGHAFEEEILLLPGYFLVEDVDASNPLVTVVQLKELP